MKMRTWVSVAAIAFLSWAAVAEEKDVYRQYVDNTLAKYADIVVEFYADQALQANQKRYRPVVDHFVKKLLFTEEFKNASADMYRKYLSKNEVTQLASAALSEECNSLFSAENMGHFYGKKTYDNIDFERDSACLKKFNGIQPILEKRVKWVDENNEIYRSLTKKALPEFSERLKQQKMIFDVADKVRKTLPKTVDDGRLDGFDIVGEHQVLEYHYLVKDILEEGEVYELETESMFKDVCGQFKALFKGYVSVRYSVFDLESKRVGETTIKLSECP